jgi:hypothetical protein
MEVFNKLIDTEEALVNQFDHDGKQDASTSGASGDSSSKFRKQLSEVLAADGCRPSTFIIEEYNVVLDSPCTFHEGVPTQFASATSSRGCSTRPKTRSNPEVTGTGHPRIATTTTAETTNVAAETTIVVTTCDVITSIRKTVATSATCLPHRR